MNSPNGIPALADNLLISFRPSPKIAPTFDNSLNTLTLVSIILASPPSAPPKTGI